MGEDPRFKIIYDVAKRLRRVNYKQVANILHISPSTASQLCGSAAYYYDDLIYSRGWLEYIGPDTNINTQTPTHTKTPKHQNTNTKTQTQTPIQTNEKEIEQVLEAEAVEGEEIVREEFERV